MLLDALQKHFILCTGLDLCDKALGSVQQRRITQPITRALEVLNNTVGAVTQSIYLNLLCLLYVFKTSALSCFSGLM